MLNHIEKTDVNYGLLGQTLSLSEEVSFTSNQSVAEFDKGICIFCSFIFFLAVVYEYGFRVSSHEIAIIHWVYQIVWVVFLIATTAQIVFRQDDKTWHFTPWTWLLTVCLYLTLLPVIFISRKMKTGVCGYGASFIALIIKVLFYFYYLCRIYRAVWFACWENEPTLHLF